MVEKGFVFFWGQDYEPTLVPPGEHVAVKCNVEKCFAASRVDHGVPIFVDEVSIVCSGDACCVFSVRRGSSR